MKTLIRLTLVISIACLIHSNIQAQDIKQTDAKFLIVLDIQECWVTKTVADSTAHKLLQTVNSLIERTDPAYVIYIKSPMYALSISFKGIKKTELPGMELDNRLLVVNNNIFIKTEGNAFTSKELCQYLNEQNAQKIIVTGLLAEKCVKQTFLGGLDQGYEMFVIPEAIVGKTLESKMKIISELKLKGVQQLSIN